MKFARSIGFLAVLASALTGCSDNSTRPGDVFRPPSATRDGLSPGLAGPDGCDDLRIAPESLRVDLIEPSFTHPLDAFNPLFPVGTLDRAVLLGLSDGEPFRTETTRLAGTRTIVIDGKPVETLISQYVAWRDRRIDEVAIDWYGQDDEGNARRSG